MKEVTLHNVWKSGLVPPQIPFKEHIAFEASPNAGPVPTPYSGFPRLRYQIGFRAFHL